MQEQWKRTGRERVETSFILQAGYRGISRLNKNQTGKLWTTRYSGSPDQSCVSSLTENECSFPPKGLFELLTLRCQKIGNVDTEARDGTHDWR